MEVNAKAESDDGGLQQKFGEAFALDVKGMRDRESVDQTAQKSEGRGNQAARSQNQGQNEYGLAHCKESGRREERRPSSSFDWRLVELIGWTSPNAGVFLQARQEGGRARVRMCETRPRGLVVLGR